MFWVYGHLKFFTQSVLGPTLESNHHKLFPHAERVKWLFIYLQIYIYIYIVLAGKVPNKYIFYQNLNSGKRRINGRNSSFDLVGNDGPSSVIKRNNSLKNTEKNTVVFKCTEFHLNS